MYSSSGKDVNKCDTNEELELSATSKFRSLDQFIIQKRIGRGQFSEVYKAICIDDSQSVAIKKVHFYDMVDAAARIDCLKEINLLQELSHVNIISYLGCFVSESRLHVVLELAEAGDLARLLKHCRRKKKLLLESTVWKYFVQICAALEHMHNKRIMHRDIKPANVFITSEGVVKLGDLGLGRFFSQKTVAAHSLVGTPYYMSPERVREHGYNFRSDIWSLGCLLYELAALRSPFYEDKMSLYGLIQKIETCQYEPLPAFAYSDKYRSLVDACIKASPSDRPCISHVHSVARQMHSFWSKAEDDGHTIQITSSRGDLENSKPYSFGI